MFHLFKKKPPVCPVNNETRVWMGQAVYWLWNQFGAELVRNKRILLPDFDHFPIVYNGEKKAAIESLSIVAAQMDVDPDDIHLDFYSDGISEVGAGGIGGAKLFVNSEEDTGKSRGIYHGEQEDG